MNGMDVSQFGFSGGFGTTFRPYTQQEIEEQERVNAYRQLMQSKYLSGIAPIQAAMAGASPLDVRRMELGAQRASKMMPNIMRQFGNMNMPQYPYSGGGGMSNWGNIGSVPNFPYRGMGS